MIDRVMHDLRNIGPQRRRSQSLRSAWLLLLVLAFGGSVTLAAGPKMEVLKKDVDFGQVTRGEQLEAVFEIKNSGDEPLRILKVKPG